MDGTTTETIRPRASTAKTALFLALVAVLLLGIVLAIRGLSNSSLFRTTDEPATSQPEKSNSATDHKIQQNAPTGATNPSPSATGPGSSNSIVGQ